MKTERIMEFRIGFCFFRAYPNEARGFSPLAIDIMWHPNKTWGCTLALFPFVIWFGWVDRSDPRTT